MKTDAQKRKAKKIASKKWRDKNKKEIAAYQKKYAAENKESIASKKKEYQDANKDKQAIRDKRYRKKNKSKVAARKKAYRDRKKEEEGKLVLYKSDIKDDHKITAKKPLPCREKKLKN